MTKAEKRLIASAIRYVANDFVGFADPQPLTNSVCAYLSSIGKRIDHKGRITKNDPK